MKTRLIIVAAVVIGIITTTALSHKSTPAATPSPPSTFSLVLNKSSCWEDLSLAYVRCDIRVHNEGAAAALPAVNVLVRYDDGSSTIFTNTTDALNDYSSPGGHSVPAYSAEDVYFTHSYDSTSHSLVQAAASLNLNAKSYLYIAVRHPQG